MIAGSGVIYLGVDVDAGEPAAKARMGVIPPNYYF
jgi:hypothetical protein